MIESILINYIFGLLVYKYKDNIKVSRVVLFINILINLFIIGYYKYANFLIKNINWIFHSNIAIMNIVMPIGISFFTFQSMSYVIDVYRGNGKVQYNPLNVALYIALFPQLIAGPIVRYETIDKQITCRKETVEQFTEGVERFIYGLAKKVIIANTFGLIADEIFSFSPLDLSVISSWIGAIAYSAQIYFDFSGYSDMAIGLGKMFGFAFLENFNYPYISKSITDFWRRWHISLSTWFRDYLYIPLGGNRGGIAKHLRNLFIVWFLTGLWHGASWNFIAWGIYYGIILVLEKYFLQKFLGKLWTPFKHIYALFFIIIGWVLFRAPNVTYAFQYIKTMLGMNSIAIYDRISFYYLTEFKVEFIIMFIASTPILHSLGNYIKNNIESKWFLEVISILKYLFLASIFLLSIMILVKSSFNPFIYFRF